MYTQFSQSALGYGYAVSGRKLDAQRKLQELENTSKQKYVGPCQIAIIYVGLGKKDQAFEWLEKAFEGKDWRLTSFKVNPVWDPIRSDPRYTDLLRRMKFLQ